MQASRKILKNMFSLSIAEIANKGIQFVTNFYIARVILPVGFGIIGFANSFVVYFLLIVNLGFNTVGTREVAKYPKFLNKYVDSILTMRLILSIFAYLALFIVVYFLDKPIEVKYVLWIIGLNLFSNAIMLDWLYQGIERMEFLALRQVITSGLSLIGLVIFVHSPSDTVVAMAVTVISLAINSVWMVMLYVKQYGKIHINFEFDLWRKIMKSSIPITFSNFSVTLLNTLSMLLLGIFRTDQETGYYNAAYKILVLTMVPTTIIQNTFFPLLSKSNTVEERRNITKKYATLMFICGTFVGVSFFTFSDFIVGTSFGPEYKGTNDILRILMITSIIVSINLSFTPALVAWKKEKQVMYAISIAGVVSTVLNFLLIPHYGTLGAAYTTICSELTVAIGLSVVFYKTIKKLYYFDFFKLLIFSLVSCFIGYLLFKASIPAAVSFFISFVIFVLFNIIFKTFTIQELKRYFAKE